MKDDYSHHECHCDCHTIPGAKLCLACCQKCPHCGKNIKIECISTHKKICGPAVADSKVGDYPPPARVFEVDDADLAP